MDPERPPDIDAEYRLVHGPWPRWAMQLGLLRLAVWTVSVVLGLMVVGLAVLWVVFRR
jgi:hypothetical protein